MRRGWYNEPNRHRLAARGIKTTTTKTDALLKAATRKRSEATKKSEEQLKKEFKDTELTEQEKAAKILKNRTDWQLVVDYETLEKTHSPKDPLTPIVKDMLMNELEKRDEKAFNSWIESNEASPRKFFWERKQKDTDGDGVPDHLDCDPQDPEKQGFYDEAKKKVLKAIKGEPREEKIVRLRAELEAKEEKLEKEKTAQLEKQLTTTTQKRELAELKAKEKELDRIQAELEEGSKKQKFKAGLKSAAKTSKIIASKGFKRLKEELKEKPPKKFTEITLTKKEEERTSFATQKKLSKQRKENAEAEAKLELKKLLVEEERIKKELTKIQGE